MSRARLPVSIIWLLSFTASGQDLLPFRKGSLFGFKNPQGVWVVDPQYKSVKPYSEGLAAAELTDGSGFIYLNEKGEQAFPGKFYKAFPFEGGSAVVADAEKGYGIINREGVYTLQPVGFSHQLSLSEGFVAVNQSGSWGYMDANGLWAIAADYSAAAPFREGMGAVKKDGKWGFVDRSGTLMIPCRFDEVRNFSEGLAAAKKDGKWGYIDYTGNWAIQPKYGTAENFSEGLAVVGYGHYIVDPEVKRGYIDKTGKEVIPIRYYICRDFVNGLAGVSESPFGKYGLIDKTGKTLLSPVFDEIFEFSPITGLASYRHKGKVGFLNAKGQEVIPAVYHAEYGFKNGFCLVADKTYRTFYIDTKGTELQEP